MPAHVHEENDDDEIEYTDEEGDKQGDNEEGEGPGLCMHLFYIAITHWRSQRASIMMEGVSKSV